MQSSFGAIENSPSTYKEWLTCFSVLKSGMGLSKSTYKTISLGHFHGGKQLMNTFQQQLVDTLNAMIEARVNSFLERTNWCIEFNECEEIVRCFNSLDEQLGDCFFFTEFNFLGSDIKDDLAKSIKNQIDIFLKDFSHFLRWQAIDSSRKELEDVLYFVNRLGLLRD